MVKKNLDDSHAFVHMVYFKSVCVFHEEMVTRGDGGDAGSRPYQTTPGDCAAKLCTATKDFVVRGTECVHDSCNWKQVEAGRWESERDEGVSREEWLAATGHWLGQRAEDSDSGAICWVFTKHTSRGGRRRKNSSQGGRRRKNTSRGGRRRKNTSRRVRRMKPTSQGVRRMKNTSQGGKGRTGK